MEEVIKKAVQRHVRQNVPKAQSRSHYESLIGAAKLDRPELLNAICPGAGQRWAKCLDTAFRKIVTDRTPHALTIISPEWNAQVNSMWPLLDEVRDELSAILA